MTLVFIVSIAALVTAGLTLTTTAVRTSAVRSATQRALAIAESGIEKAAWCLNNLTTADTAECPRSGSIFSGETNVALGDGSYSSSWNQTTQTITVTATINGSGGTTTKIVTAKVTKTSDDIAFNYGVQVGQGGLTMDNNSYIQGNVYSNGSVVGQSTLAEIRGSVIVAGGTALNPDQEQNLQNGEVVIGKDPTEDGAQSFQPGDTDVINKVELYLKRTASAPADATIRIVNNSGGSPGTTTLASGTLNSSLVTTTFGWIEVPLTTNPVLTSGQTYWLVIDANDSNTKYYTWGKHDNSGYGNGVGKTSANWSAGGWADANGDFAFRTYLGGVTTGITNIKIPSSVTGAVAEAHEITGASLKATVTCATMDGTTVTGGVTCGSIDSSTIAGNVITDGIESSTVTGNLTCETRTSTTVTGTVTCPMTFSQPSDPAPAAFPVSDANIDQWQADALLGGTHSGNLVLNSDTTLGPRVISGDLSFGSTGIVLTINGTVYVQGKMSVSNGSQIKCGAGYGPESCIIVVDGSIDLSNNATFAGSGESTSFVLLLSNSTCDGLLGSNCAPNTSAIYVKNNANGVIFYAPDGRIHLSQNVSLTEATGHSLHLENGANVTYQQGLVDTKFSSGPGAGWQYKKGSFRIVQ